MSLSTNSFITIDHGNTHSRLVIHDTNDLKEISLDQYLKDENYNKLPGIISHVGKKGINFPEHLISLKTIFEEGKFLDMPVNYEKTLGEDRLINAYYSYKKLLNNKKTLIIDAGTFVTLDIVSPDQGFLGGYIIPGETTYLKSFSHGSDLPVFEKAILVDNHFLPNNTQAAIIQSYQLILKSSIEAMIKEQKIKNIIVTGGSKKLIQHFLKEYLDRTDLLISLQDNLVHSSLSYLYRKLQGEGPE